MRILLTNDDGIRAPGIAAMYSALIDPNFGPPLGEVFCVAPLEVQSATSHGVTFHAPLMTRTESIDIGTPVVKGIAVDGRPADCVKLALSCLWPERFGEGSRPDLVISGMNAGANCGINVIYSGTVAAAIEAAFLGVPSIAVSMMLTGERSRFDVAAREARQTIERLIAQGLPGRHECLSINIPSVEAERAMPPIRVSPMNTHGLVDRYERRVSPGGQVYYWAAGHGLDFHATAEGSDVDLLKAGCITVTPLDYDLTCHGSLESWRSRVKMA